MGRNIFFLTSFSLFRRAMNRTPWALQACAEVCACDRTPLRERLENWAGIEIIDIQMMVGIM